MIEYDFHQEAAGGLEVAVDYYNLQKVGLGREFLNEVGRLDSTHQTSEMPLHAFQDDPAVIG